MLFADPDHELGDVLEEVAQRGVRLLMQSVLVAEVTESRGASATPAVSVSGPRTATATTPRP